MPVFFGSDAVSVASFLTGTEWTALQSKDLSASKVWDPSSAVGDSSRHVHRHGDRFAVRFADSDLSLSEFASDKIRTWLKPTLEIIAGVPTVVLGFFALLVISPVLQALTGGAFSTFNATSAGIAVANPVLADGL